MPPGVRRHRSRRPRSTLAMLHDTQLRDGNMCSPCVVGTKHLPDMVGGIHAAAILFRQHSSQRSLGRTVSDNFFKIFARGGSSESWSCVDCGTEGGCSRAASTGYGLSRCQRIRAETSLVTHPHDCIQLQVGSVHVLWKCSLSFKPLERA